MTEKSSRSGYYISAAAHTSLLVLALVGFSDARKFDDVQESVPVEVVTNQQFNDIMKGEKTAKLTKPTPKAQKLADIAVSKPEVPTPDAKIDVPVPPPPLKRLPDPGEADVPLPPKPPVQQALAAPEPPLPPHLPPRPEPAKPLPPKAEIKPPPPDLPQAEVIAPEPPPKPAPPPKLPDPPPAPDKPKPDPIAKILAAAKAKEAGLPLPKPKSGEPASETKHPDFNAIADLLRSKDTIQHKAATANKASQTAALGAPTARAARMSPSQLGQFDSLVKEHYRRCWNQSNLDTGNSYVAQITVHFRADGSLINDPVWRNPSDDPQARSIGETALRAIRQCGPVSVPVEFAAFYNEWKDGILLMKPGITE